MNKIFIISLLCAVFMGVSSRAQTQDTSASSSDSLHFGTIEGKVVGDIIGDTLSGCLIHLYAIIRCNGCYNSPDSIKWMDTTRTDSNGRFRFNHMPLGRYNIYADCYGFGMVRLYYDLKRNNKDTIVFRLIPGESPPDARRPLVDPHDVNGTVRTWTKDEIDHLPKP